MEQDLTAFLNQGLLYLHCRLLKDEELWEILNISSSLYRERNFYGALISLAEKNFLKSSTFMNILNVPRALTQEELQRIYENRFRGVHASN